MERPLFVVSWASRSSAAFGLASLQTMIGIGENLKQFWRCQGIRFLPGAREEELTIFETKYEVLLPKDLREYLAAVNGFEGTDYWVSDNNLITFLTLSEIKPLSEYWSPKVEEAPAYFVFADYSISAHLYAILLRSTRLNKNPVVVVYDDKLVEIAPSFSEFVKSYLAQIEEVLFPPLPAERLERTRYDDVSDVR